MRRCVMLFLMVIVANIAGAKLPDLIPYRAANTNQALIDKGYKYMYGYADSNLTVKIKPQFLSSQFFVDDYALVTQWDNEKDTVVRCIINKTGKVIFKVNEQQVNNYYTYNLGAYKGYLFLQEAISNPSRHYDKYTTHIYNNAGQEIITDSIYRWPQGYTLVTKYNPYAVYNNRNINTHKNEFVIIGIKDAYRDNNRFSSNYLYSLKQKKVIEFDSVIPKQELPITINNKPVTYYLFNNSNPHLPGVLLYNDKFEPVVNRAFFSVTWEAPYFKVAMKAGRDGYVTLMDLNGQEVNYDDSYSQTNYMPVGLSSLHDTMWYKGEFYIKKQYFVTGAYEVYNDTGRGLYFPKQDTLVFGNYEAVTVQADSTYMLGSKYNTGLRFYTLDAKPINKVPYHNADVVILPGQTERVYQSNYGYLIKRLDNKNTWIKVDAEGNKLDSGEGQGWKTIPFSGVINHHPNYINTFYNAFVLRNGMTGLSAIYINPEVRTPCIYDQFFSRTYGGHNRDIFDANGNIIASRAEYLVMLNNQLEEWIQLRNLRDIYTVGNGMYVMYDVDSRVKISTLYMDIHGRLYQTPELTKQMIANGDYVILKKREP